MNSVFVTLKIGPRHLIPIRSLNDYGSCGAIAVAVAYWFIPILALKKSSYPCGFYLFLLPPWPLSPPFGPLLRVSPTPGLWRRGGSENRFKFGWVSPGGLMV